VLFLLPATAIALVVAQFHLIRTREGFRVIRKWTGTFTDSYVDAREPPFAEEAHDPSLADTLLFSGRTRFFETGSAPATPSPHAAEALARGMRYLEAQQQADGSWRSFKSRSPDFTKAMEQPRVFPTIVALLALRQLAAGNPGMIDRGLAYLRGQMGDDFLWAVDGRDHELSFRWDHLPCVMPPDTDDTALAWILVGSELGVDALRRVHTVFERHVLRDGLYPTYLTGAVGPGACPPDYENRPSLGVNVDVLAFFEHYGFETGRLRWGLEDALAVHEYWKDAVYYRNAAVLAFLAATAVANGAPSAAPLLDRFLADYERSRTGVDTPATALETASYVAAASDRCRTRSGDCGALRDRVSELLRSQREDGSWPAAPVYEASQGFYGSPAETTAIAVRALDSWLRTPAGATAADSRAPGGARIRS
jgi:hypothetical protein